MTASAVHCSGSLRGFNNVGRDIQSCDQMSLPIFFTYGGVVLSLSIELLLSAGYDGGKAFVQGPVLGRAVAQE